MLATWWLPPAEALKNLRATLGILADARALSRVRFLGVAERIGLVAALRTPATVDELGRTLGIADVDLLHSLLDVGVALGELRRRNGRYRLKGNRIRALASPDGEGLRGFTAELAVYRGDVYRDLPAGLHQRQPGLIPRRLRRGGGTGVTIGRTIHCSLRSPVGRRPISWHHAGNRLRHRNIYPTCGGSVPAAVCGRDRLVRACHRTCVSQLGCVGTGRPVSCTACRHSRSNLAELAGPFDLITLHNNIYYFSLAERPTLLVNLRRRLAPRGRLVLTSMLAGNTLSAAELDLVLRSTAGCWPLPEREELVDALTDAGYHTIALYRLLPTEPLFGVVARPGAR